MKKAVSIVAWIPLQLVAYLSVDKLFNDVMCYIESFSPRYGYHHRFSSLFTIQFLAFAVIGLLIVFRNEYGSKIFWKHFLLLYIGYHFACSSILLVNCQNFMVMLEIISTSLFPAFSLLGLMLVVLVTRGVMYLQAKINKNASK